MSLSGPREREPHGPGGQGQGGQSQSQSQPEQSPQLKKKVKPGAIELDPLEPVIVVHFETLIQDLTQIGTLSSPSPCNWFAIHIIYLFITSIHLFVCL